MVVALGLGRAGICTRLSEYVGRGHRFRAVPEYLAQCRCYNLEQQQGKGSFGGKKCVRCSQKLQVELFYKQWDILTSEFKVVNIIGVCSLIGLEAIQARLLVLEKLATFAYYGSIVYVYFSLLLILDSLLANSFKQFHSMKSKMRYI